MLNLDWQQALSAHALHYFCGLGMDKCAYYIMPEAYQPVQSLL